jgi:hypothetical protein
MPRDTFTRCLFSFIAGMMLALTLAYLVMTPGR